METTQQFILGIDIGGTKIAGGIVDARTGTLLTSERIATEAQKGGADVLHRAILLAQKLYDNAPSKPAFVGVGAGGQIDYATGVVLSALESILPSWAGLNLKQAFENALQLPTKIDNDVNALATGECRFGAGRNRKSVVFLALGTGVGGAVIYQNQLLRGAHGIDTELGQLYLSPHVTLESRCCGDALWSRFLEQGGNPKTERKTLAVLAQNDPQSPAGQAIYILATDLGWGLVSCANLFDPEIFIIGGGLAALGDLIILPAQKILQENALERARNTPIALASLGAEASVIGAASLAISK